MDLKTQILAQIEQARRTGRKLPKRLKRTPKQAYPAGAELDYARALMAEVEALWQAIKDELLPQLPALDAAARSEGLRADAFPDDVDMIAERLRRRMEARQRITERRTEEAVTRIASFNRNQIANQVKTVLGVDVLAAEPWLRSEMAVWTRENARLIKDVSERAIGNVDRIVTDGIRDGKSTRTLTKEIREQLQTTRRRATLIARDQVGKFNGRLTQLRHRDLGVTDYIWRGVLDGRERPAHIAREGKRFSWDSPPPDGHPGQPVQCRCTAEPVMDEFADLLGATPASQPATIIQHQAAKQQAPTGGGNLPPGSGIGEAGGVTGGGRGGRSSGGGGGNGPNHPEPVHTHLVGPDKQNIPAVVRRLTVDDLDDLHEWFPSEEVAEQHEFDWWLTEEKIARKEANGGYYMAVEANGRIQGMATFAPNSLGPGDVEELYVGTIETAPWNHDPDTRDASGVLLAVLEAAANESLRIGQNGRVGLIASTEKLIETYTRMHMVEVPQAYMVLDGENVGRLLAERKAQRGG